MLEDRPFSEKILAEVGVISEEPVPYVALIAPG